MGIARLRAPTAIGTALGTNSRLTDLYVRTKSIGNAGAAAICNRKYYDRIYLQTHERYVSLLLKQNETPRRDFMVCCMRRFLAMFRNCWGEEEGTYT